MNKYERAREHAVRELVSLVVICDDQPTAREAQARRVADALSYLTSVLYGIPLPKQEDDDTPPPPDTLAQIREAVDKDSTDPEEWYRMILKVRDIVGVTR